LLHVVTLSYVDVDKSSVTVNKDDDVSPRSCVHCGQSLTVVQGELAVSPRSDGSPASTCSSTVCDEGHTAAPDSDDECASLLSDDDDDDDDFDEYVTAIETIGLDEDSTDDVDDTEQYDSMCDDDPDSSSVDDEEHPNSTLTDSGVFQQSNTSSGSTLLDDTDQLPSQDSVQAAASVNDDNHNDEDVHDYNFDDDEDFHDYNFDEDDDEDDSDVVDDDDDMWLSAALFVEVSEEPDAEDTSPGTEPLLAATGDSDSSDVNQ